MNEKLIRLREQVIGWIELNGKTLTNTPDRDLKNRLFAQNSAFAAVIKAIDDSF